MQGLQGNRYCGTQLTYYVLIETYHLFIDIYCLSRDIAAVEVQLVQRGDSMRQSRAWNREEALKIARTRSTIPLTGECTDAPPSENRYADA